ncbi:cytidine deaminase-like protein [Pilobolus umbonatus]|nr:cytidine deaminase-like protein [Pilobolus umbonatus]
MKITTNKQDVFMMTQAIHQAHQSIPAPQAYCVGAVIADKNGNIVSTGYSRELPGNTHAEECALMKTQEDLEGATMYTTMEPCSVRLSKNTPCCDRILKSKIKRVVLGVKEPPNLVQCQGIQLLQQQGIEVLMVPDLEEQCLAPNKHILQ